MVAAASNAHPWFIQGLLHLNSTVSAATEELGTAGPLESKALSHDMREGHVTGGPADQSREVLMGVGNGVASVIMLTFTKRPGPHADTAWAVVG